MRQMNGMRRGPYGPRSLSLLALTVLAYLNCNSARVPTEPVQAGKKHSSSNSGDTGSLPPAAPPRSLKRPEAIGAEKVLSGAIGSRQKRHARVLYDPIQRLFLVIHGNAQIGAIPVDENGDGAGAGVRLDQAPEWAATPQLVYDPDRNRFLALWYQSHDERSYDLMGRFLEVRNRSIQLTSLPFVVQGTLVSRATGPVGAAYVSSRKQFFVTWQNGGADVGIDGRFMSDSGRAAGDLLRIAGHNGDWFDEPAAAYSPESDRILVSYSYWSKGDVGEARYNMLDAGGIGNALVLRSVPGAGVACNQALWIPHRKKFVVAWSHDQYNVRYVSADGQAEPEGHFVFPGKPAYVEGMGFGYNAFTQSYMFVRHHESSYGNPAVEVYRDFTSSEEIMAIPSGGFGSFGPHVAGSTAGDRWLVVTARDYSRLLVRVIRTPLAM